MTEACRIVIEPAGATGVRGVVSWNVPHRLSRLAGAALLLGGTACAAPARVCALPEVLRTVSLELHRHGIDGVIDDRNPGQLSDGGTAITCSVRLIRRYYDTNRFGETPQYIVDVRTFQVRRLQHSLLVELTD